MSESSKFIAKVHNVGGMVTVAICDPELINETLIGPHGVKVKVNESFYGNQQFSPEELIEFLKNAMSINVIGKKSVDFLISRGYGSWKSVIMLGEVPHLIFIKM